MYLRNSWNILRYSQTCKVNVAAAAAAADDDDDGDDDERVCVCV